MSSDIESSFSFDDDQIEAIKAACDTSNRFVAVTGPAGTGKTRLIKVIYDKLTEAGYKVAITAPTGKAAKRVQESTGIEAQTNHRLLGYGMPIEITGKDDVTGKEVTEMVPTGPRYNRNNPLPYDVIIGDEYAMVNSTIHGELMAALRPGGRFIATGDKNQLPPIEEGRRLANNEPRKPSPFETALVKCKSVVLKTIHRQRGDGTIAENCGRILKRLSPRSTDDFIIRMTDQPVKLIKDLFFELQEQGYDLTSTDCQLITPTNKTWVGVEKLNNLIQSLVFDRRQPYIELPRHEFFRRTRIGSGTPPETMPIRVQVGTKIVYTANVYDMNDEHKSAVFNGETGTVVSFDDVEGTVVVDFGDRIVAIPSLITKVQDDGKIVELDPRKNIALAYALTTHKVQGSEFKCVVVVLNKSSLFAQSQQNFYTACSRAKERCVVVTDQVSLRTSVVKQA